MHTFTAVGKYTDVGTATGMDTITGMAVAPVVASQSVVVVQPSTPLSAGYWKNHLSAAASLLPLSLGGYAVPVASVASAVFAAMNCGTSSSQNAVGCLTGQLLATELNVANNASDVCIYTTMVSAAAFLKSIGYTGPGGNYSKLTAAQRSSAVTLATTLGNYNTGVAPGCA
jgi:hypothetical protein